MKLYRWIWWSVWFEFPFALFLIVTLAGKNPRGNLRRWRFPLIACLAIATMLQMWAANVMLNLIDTAPAQFLSSTERLRARVALFGFAALSAINIITMFMLGDDGAVTGLESDVLDPLLVGTPGLDRPGLTTTV
jgi:hypothetical protein